MKSKFLALLVALGAISASAHAATITWSVSNIADDSTQVSTTGTLVAARIGTAGPDAGVTVNGVFFDDLGTLDTATNQDNITTRTGVFTDPNYKAILQFYSRNNNSSDQPITFSGLTVGNIYQVQLWIADNNVGTAGTVGMVLNNGSGAPNPGTSGHVTLLPEVTEGGYGQFALGTFTADASSQVLTVRRWNNLTTTPVAAGLNFVNAWQVRDLGASIPEPSSAMLGGLGLLALLRRRK